jgi:hypothetical protein
MNRFILFSGLLFILFLSASFTARAQEYLLPLHVNPQLISNQPLQTKKSINNTLLELPVADDFAQQEPYPNPEIWADNYVYINNQYAVNPPSIGVATMDALDYNGSIYPFATIDPVAFNADLLTSLPINLDYPASDSIYFSFFYQPMGNGLMPRAQDSLCADFYDPVSDNWINIWRVPGDTLQEFEQVMIPIKEDLFLKEGFRFRFRNKASLPQNADYRDKRGNVDHWNIDYVKLDRNRSISDTVIRDVAFQKALPSLLKNLESLPWDHFQAAYNSIYLSYITLNYYNNDTIIRNVTRSAEMYDEVWDELYSPAVTSTQDIFPGTFTVYNINDILYPFNFNRGDTAIFRVKAWLRTDVFDNKSNDTTFRNQVFRDYFAYDDGTAERAYGLRGQGTNNGFMAVRFNSYIPDELGGIDLYFTQLFDSLNLDYFFRFMVWDDVNGMPGNVIYEDEFDHSVQYSDRLNKFVRFKFKETVPVNGIFYVGLMQYNQYLLNIGMDINKPANSNLLYNIGNGWQVSSAPGSLMLRPYIKRNYNSIEKSETLENELRIWPNPASDIIWMDHSPENDDAEIGLIIYDITGKAVARFHSINQQIYTGNLAEGIYLFKFTSEKHNFKTQRILIQR